MSLVNTDAIILHSIDFMEADKIVCALTRDRGIIHAIAKGAKNSRKRFPGTLEPFCEVSMDVFVKKEGDLHRLESCQLADAHLGIRENLDLLAHSTVMIELIKEHLGQMDPHPETFDHLSRALAAMEPDRQWFSVWCVALLNILSTLGYGIDLKVEGETGGGLRVVPNKLSREATAFLVGASRLSDEVLQRLSVKDNLKREISVFLLSVCNHVSDKRLKSGSFLAKLLDFDANQ
jgi:recombinational DNA repair protein (RecF pathway)